MLVLKIAETDRGLAILLDEEAKDLLGATPGREVRVEISAQGEIVLAPPDDSFEARHARGRAFLKRYKRTFDALSS